MQLARAAAARTLTDRAAPEAPPAAEPPTPPAAEPPTPPAAEPPPPPAAEPPTRPAAATPSYKPTDPAILFTRLAAVVRDCIALEARLAAGAAPSRRTLTCQLRADPRRAPLREALRHATLKHPDHAELFRETTTRLDEHLTADTGQTVEPPHLFATICNELGIELDLATLPDEYLNALYEATHAPDPRATSPP
jgi:hypothetical protein